MIPMFHADFQDLVNDERIHRVLFLILIGTYVYSEAKSWWNSLLRPLYVKITSTLSDYRSGKFYKPWGPTTPIVIVSTKKQIAELSEAPCLSQRAVYADMFGFKHTMNKLEHNTSNNKVIRTRLYSRLLQVNGPVHLDGLYPHLLNRFDINLERELRGGRVLNGESRILDIPEVSIILTWKLGGISLPIAQTARRLVSNLMGLMFFGEALSSDEEFSSALLRYPQDMVKCMAAFQVAPSLVHAVLTNRGEAMHLIQKRLFQCIQSGLSNQSEGDKIQRHTILYNIIALTSGSEYWNADLLSQSLLGIWFAASHQPWMNLHFVILELCARKEWQSKLRQEIEQHVPLDYKDLEQLPLLDGFIKETVRCNPLDTLAIRRKALEPYTFSDGSLSVPSGATVCVSSYDLMHNPQTYPDPNAFNPSRYLPKEPNSQQLKFTEVSEAYPIWGYGSLACPGRFQASLAMKLVISQLLLKYDLSLENKNARTKWSWETFAMPYKSTRVILKEHGL
ncbi:cytochrome P450 [Daldinia vernicosa]|uniref:cytochrome P450 n=1 Tax=Daldinia vernicosa TaxID=114800 RepID=UPI0020080002|nr:cytochrome P450 [Daldinia vernicosa]KAI0853766.1 cytochrome P450 [Daldinia vernicosa]